MTTIRDLAAEFSTQPYELRAFADDMLDGLADTDEIPADSETFIREALAIQQGLTPAPLVAYRVEVQTSPDGLIWQSIHTETVEVDFTALEVAEAAAQNQNVIDDEDGWRIRVYLGDDNDHVAEAGPAVDGMGLTELSNRIAALASMPAIDRATSAAALSISAKATLARIRRAAIFEATRTQSWSDVALKLDVSTSAINQLVTQHRSA